MSSSNEQGAEVSIWPLLHLRANWAARVIDCLDLGVKLIPADGTALNAMKEILGPNANIHREYELDDVVQWLLAVPVGKECVYADSARLGISTREEVAAPLVATFLLCLRLVRRTSVVCPMWFDGRIDPDGFLVPGALTAAQDYEVPDLGFYPASVIGEEEVFEEGDLGEIAHLWHQLVDSLSLADFLGKARSEKFWQEIDRKATRKLIRDLEKNHPRLWDSPGRTEELLAVMQDLPVYQDKHADAFRTALKAHIDEAFLRATRLGRALGLFNAGFESGSIGTFLLMCFALETLFTVDDRAKKGGKKSKSMTEKLKTRVAKLLVAARQAANSEEVEGEMKRLLEERGDIVHGSKGIESVPKQVQGDAVEVTRLSLRAILSRPKLLELYCDPSTSATPEGREDVGRLREFYRKLDEGTACFGKGE